MEIYVVDRGDNVDQIAASTGISVWQLIYDNQLIYPYELAVGQALVIDNGIRNASRAVSVSGYAYPFISEWVLAETLPFLSELPIFSYGFTMEGELIPPLWVIRTPGFAAGGAWVNRLNWPAPYPCVGIGRGLPG